MSCWTQVHICLRQQSPYFCKFTVFSKCKNEECASGRWNVNGNVITRVNGWWNTNKKGVGSSILYLRAINWLQGMFLTCLFHGMLWRMVCVVECVYFVLNIYTCNPGMTIICNKMKHNKNGEQAYEMYSSNSSKQDLHYDMFKFIS